MRPWLRTIVGATVLEARAGGRLELQLNRRARATVRRAGSLRAVVSFVFVGNGRTTEVERTVRFVRR